MYNEGWKESKNYIRPEEEAEMIEGQNIDLDDASVDVSKDGKDTVTTVKTVDLEGWMGCVRKMIRIRFTHAFITIVNIRVLCTLTSDFVLFSLLCHASSALHSNYWFCIV